jgi:hypothetical protein
MRESVDPLYIFPDWMKDLPETTLLRQHEAFEICGYNPKSRIAVEALITAGRLPKPTTTLRTANYWRLKESKVFVAKYNEDLK